MNQLVAIRNTLGVETVRLADDDLHRAARRGIHDGNHVVFRILPATITQILKHKVWRNRSRKFKDFGEYALDQTSDGLGIENNQQLWLLRCAMDVHGAHIKEWADVLAKVENMVRVQVVKDRNSLEELAKHGDDIIPGDRITYLPSRQKALDGHLIRLRNSKPDVFRKVISGGLTVLDARKAAGLKTGNESNLARARSAFRRMKPKERSAFLAWLKAEQYL
jgi:hypothetical protein